MGKMDALKMLKEKVRLTEDCRIECDQCRLRTNINGTIYNCSTLMYYKPEKYVEIIEEWSKDCPERTCLDNLIRFPEYKIN